MTIWRLVLKEALHRKLNFVLGLVSVAAAAGCLIGALMLLDAHDLRTRQILQEKERQTQQVLQEEERRTRQSMAELEDAIRKAMLGLGFNIVILPKEQKLDEWYADSNSTSCMPEQYVERLRRSKIITVQHLLPILQAKVRWEEKKRSIILVGTRGEIPGIGAKRPMVQPVAEGEIVLGYELHDSLGLKVADKLKLNGREFAVRECYAMRGNKDDITAWIDLATAQEMLGKKGWINAIMALECECAWADLGKVREEIARILPETQIIERGSEALTRAEARRKVAEAAAAAMARVAEEGKAELVREENNRGQLRAERERLASILVPLVMLASAALVAVLALSNARERRGEIGILRAIGVRSRKVLLLFLSKAVVVGVGGGAIGCIAGYFAGRYLGAGLDHAGARAAFEPIYAGLALGVAPVLAAVASWIPAMLASQQEPAVILREE